MLQISTRQAVLTRFRPFLWSIIVIPILNVLYLLSLNWQSDPAMLESITQQAAFELWTIGGLIDAIRRGRYPSGLEIISLPHYEIILSILLTWFLAALGLALLWIALSYVLRPAPHRRLILLALIAALALMMFVPAMLVRFPTATTAQITIDTAQTIGTFPSTQRAFSQGGEIEMQQGGYFASVAEKLNPLRPTLIRIDHIFDYYKVYQMNTDGSVHYNWAQLDPIVDAILATGAKPLINLSYLPQSLAKDTIYGPPNDWNKWEELVYQTVYHFNVERHLNIEYWEVWNEPNTTSFWNGSLDDYLQLYASTAQGALRADSTIKLGGPATLSLHPESAMGLPFYEQTWITTLAQYTIDHHLPLKFVSWHYYESRPDKFAWNVHLHQQWLANTGLQPELLITEWNLTGGSDTGLDTEQDAAYAAAVVTVLADTGISHAFFFEPFDSSRTWQGAWGMIRADGVLKPVYYAFQLAAKLNGQRLYASSDHKLAGVLAARDDKNTVDILLWNIKSERISDSIYLSGLPPNGSMHLNISGVDADHGNAYRGKNIGDLSISSIDKQVDSNGNLRIVIDLPANSVRLLEIR